ncbi:hypothetical protein COY27_04265 [Candidatus Woesearchaeota archaeon CG_4_10_14_0_2_um_filter_33_13]|nr:MAG: hypothetical protein COY27_04265 [Candidatus Woesearchaeota archaeon CG_4_10_14_0_2_um_filter_33_13]
MFKLFAKKQAKLSAGKPAKSLPKKPALKSLPLKGKASKGNAKVCGCSKKVSTATEDQIRDLINLIMVYKSEEVLGVSTRIEPKTAKELVKKLEELAKSVGKICVC